MSPSVMGNGEWLVQSHSLVLDTYCTWLDC